MGELGVAATIRLPRVDFNHDEPRLSAVSETDSASTPGRVIVVAGAASQLGLHFIRLLIESRDFNSILVRGLVPAAPTRNTNRARQDEQLQMVRRALDRFCAEDTTRRVELVSVPYCSHGYTSAAVDATVGSSLDSRLGVRPGTLLRSQCLQRTALREAMSGCLYVISCWGSELQSVFRSNGELGVGDGARGVADVVGAEYGSVASLLSEAARQSAVQFVHVSAILGDSAGSSGSDIRRGFGRWWSSWSLSAMLYRSTNEEALLWKKRAEILVRRAGAAVSSGGCGLPYTIIRLAPLRPRMRPKRGGSAMLYNDAIAVGSSATAEVTISQIVGSTVCRRRDTLTHSCLSDPQLHRGPIWEPCRPRPKLVNGGEDWPQDVQAAASGLATAVEAVSSDSAAALQLDPVDAARVVLFCMGNSATLRTSFEVRGRTDGTDATGDDTSDGRTDRRSASDQLPDLLAPLLPDDELDLPKVDDEAFSLYPTSSSLKLGAASTGMATPLSHGSGVESRSLSLPASQAAASSCCTVALVRVAPWSRVVAAEKIAVIDDSTDARTTHPLAREGEWEPFICYKVQLQMVVPQIQTGATDTQDLASYASAVATDESASAHGSLSFECSGTKPSGELQDWVVCFRYRDFSRLQEVLEDNLTGRQRQQKVWAQQLRQKHNATPTFMQEEKEQIHGTRMAMVPAAGLPVGGEAVAAAADAVLDRATRLEDDEKLVSELRALLPPSRWFKTDNAVVLERRTALQAYLDVALQAKPSDRTLEPVGSTGCVSDAANDAATGAGAAANFSQYAECTGDLVQRWVSVAFARCGSVRPSAAET